MIDGDLSSKTRSWRVGCFLWLPHLSRLEVSQTLSPTEAFMGICQMVRYLLLRFCPAPWYRANLEVTVVNFLLYTVKNYTNNINI